MIELLKHGKNINNVVTKCQTCGCVFRFEDGVDTYHNRIKCADYVDCPDCKEEILVHDTSCYNDNPNKFMCEIFDEYDE